VTIEDRIREREASRNFSLTCCPAGNDLAQSDVRLSLAAARERSLIRPSDSFVLTKEASLTTAHWFAGHWSRPLPTGSASQTETDLNSRKRATGEFLTGTRTHIMETRICAKMNEEMSQTR